jgi:hypothetical protein
MDHGGHRLEHRRFVSHLLYPSINQYTKSLVYLDPRVHYPPRGYTEAYYPAKRVRLTPDGDPTITSRVGSGIIDVTGGERPAVELPQEN